VRVVGRKCSFLKILVWIVLRLAIGRFRNVVVFVERGINDHKNAALQDESGCPVLVVWEQ